MAGNKTTKKPGYGKILDAWAPPDDAGEPIGCLATTFTFDPGFFETECLSRFLSLETAPQEDGALHLIEREGKMDQILCGVLVDQHHCKGIRSLRWDLLSARMKMGILHAKISLLLWTKHLRLIIASANLTENGYRLNHEIFGILDYHEGSKAPLNTLKETIGYLKKVAGSTSNSGPTLERWNELLDSALIKSRTWGRKEDKYGVIRINACLSGPGLNSIPNQLRNIWPGNTLPDEAWVISPFFDDNSPVNKPAAALWKSMRKRGSSEIIYCVPTEDVPGKRKIILNAPQNLKTTKPENENATIGFGRLFPEEGRPWHAKAIRLDSSSLWTLYMIGSSNFTSSGMGIGRAPNYEANLAYILDLRRHQKHYKTLVDAFPKHEVIEDPLKYDFKPDKTALDDDTGNGTFLPDGFRDAVLINLDDGSLAIKLSFFKNLPPGWKILNEDEDKEPLFIEKEWLNKSKPDLITLIWKGKKPPSGFFVTWRGCTEKAWWPVNIISQQVLPPPDELKDLCLEDLMEILTSSKPLHQAIKRIISKKKGRKKGFTAADNLDPHKRVDTSEYLLQKSRKFSLCLRGLRERLEKPAPAVKSLEWRFYGPIGVVALFKAVEAEAQSPAEKAFLGSELVLELSRVSHKTAPGCLSVRQVCKAIKGLIKEIRNKLGKPKSMHSGMKKYVKRVFKEAGRL